MKKVVLLAMLVSLVSVSQAQQTVVKKPASVPSLDGQSVAAKPVQDRAEPAPVQTSLRKNTTRAPRVQNNLFEIGLMANTFAMIGDNRIQIACDPSTNSVAVTYRGNDRGSGSVGNTVYVRYSTDNGATWGAQGSNVANTTAPRYPQVFLYNPTKSSSISSVKSVVLWPQTITFTSGTSNFGEMDAVVMGVGNTTPSYGKFPSPPAWSIANKIVPDYVNGKLYTTALALDPANGSSLAEIHLLSSTDGKTWTPVDINNPAWDESVVPTGYFGTNLRLDVSPDGSTIMMAWMQIEETSPGSGSAYLLAPNHGVAYRLSTDGGHTWGAVQNVTLLDIKPANLPNWLAGEPKTAWDLDALLDAKNNPHFMIVGSNDINPFTPFDDAPTDSTILLDNVDSTFAVEITRKGVTADWEANLIGRVHRVRVDRRSYFDGTSYALFRNEPHLARSLDGNKIYAKWTTTNKGWSIANVAGTPTLFSDTIRNVWVAGRDINSTFSYPYWGTDSMVTNNTEIDAKYTKMAHFAGNGGQLHIIYTEWGIGERVDEDANNTDNTVWYIKDVVEPAAVSVEQVSSAPGAFTLDQNYPNPFNPGTMLSFTLPHSGVTKLTVYNVLGQPVATLVNEFLAAGSHRTLFNAGSLPSGVYLYRLESNGYTATRTMTLAK